MVFKGDVLSVSELLRAAQTPSEEPSAGLLVEAGVRHTAARSARRAAELLAAGEDLAAVWRFGVLQTLDDYSSTLHRGGAELASGVFEAAPAPTGSRRVDAAYAALAEWVAERDGWRPPRWVLEPTRSVLPERWYATTPARLRAEADETSPRPFRSRGIYITPRALSRA